MTAFDQLIKGLVTANRPSQNLLFAVVSFWWEVPPAYAAPLSLFFVALSVFRVSTRARIECVRWANKKYWPGATVASCSIRSCADASPSTASTHTASLSVVPLKMSKVGSGMITSS